MKILHLILLFSFFSSVSSYNEKLEKAEIAYKQKSWIECKNLLDSNSNPRAQLNVGHCLYQLKDSTTSLTYRKSLEKLENNNLQAFAYLQLGNSICQKVDFDKISMKDTTLLQEALLNYKRALQKAHTNEKARYNYEVLYRILEQLKNQQNKNKQEKNNKDQKDQQGKDKKDKDQKEKDQKNQQDKDKKDKDQKDQQDKDKKDKDQKEKEPTEGQTNKTKIDSTRKITKAQAKKLLKTLNQKEQKYIQQLKRKNVQPIDPNKPDW